MIRRRLAIVLVAMLLALALPASVMAAGQLYNCGNGVRVIAYENSSTDHSDGDDTLAICVPPNNELWIPNLAVISHTVPTECNSFWFGNTTWTNCISGFWVQSGWTLCYYRSPNYGGGPYEWIGNNNRFNLGSATNDNVESIKIKAGAQARCTLGASPSP